MLNALALFAVVGCGGGGQIPAAPEEENPAAPLRESLLGLWKYQQSLIEKSPGRVFDRVVQGFDPRTYPSEAAVGFLSAWALTKDSAYLQSAQRQLEFAHSLENADHLLPFHGSEQVVAKVSQARIIWGYLIAYRATNDKRYLLWSDDAASSFKNLKRSSATTGRNSHNIFHYTYQSTPPYNPIGAAIIDPNQEAIIGLIFTILYHTPESRFHQDSSVRSIALESLDAVVAVQTSDGKIPITQFRTGQPDSLYGAFAAMGLLWANQYWNSTEYDVALQRAASWLGDLTARGISERYYPTTKIGATTEPVEMYYRLPLLHKYEQHFDRGLFILSNLLQNWRSFGDVPSGWLSPTLPMHWMGVPDAIFE